MDSSPKILVVEDDSITAFHLKMLFDRHNFQCMQIKRGSEVIDAVDSYAPQLILMDSMLEDEVPGLKAAEDLRAHCDTPIIFLTALTDQDTVSRINKMVNTSRIPKPFNSKDLMKQVMELI